MQYALTKQFELLKTIGAGDFQHLNGSLLSHLQGTEALLNKWGANETLKSAGLFHAAYGTSAFELSMVSLARRKEIADVIGHDSEALVYLYCSCDREFVFQQFAETEQINFKDRFTNTRFKIPVEQLQDFCELTVANELELVYASEEFKCKHGTGIRQLFTNMDSFLSSKAIEEYNSALPLTEFKV